MALDHHDLAPAVERFLTDRHLATLTTLRADGSPHVVPVGFTWDPLGPTVRVITSAGSVKATNAAADGARAAVCQVDGGAWLTIEGPCTVTDDPAAVADAEARYTRRYRPPRDNPGRVVVVIAVDRMMGRAPS